MGVLNRGHWLGALGVVLLGLAGCSFGPTALERNRTKYNEAISETWNEQFLLNLVRLRYRDRTQFDAVTNILSQHQFGASLTEQEQFRSGAGHLGRGGTGAASNLFTQYLLTPTANISEQPTISFAPMEGADFTKSLLGPIHLENILALSNTGWDVDRVMRLTISDLNGIENVGQVSGGPGQAPQFEKFLVLVRRLRELQMRGWLELTYEDFPTQLAQPIAKDVLDLTTSDVMNAADKKYDFKAGPELMKDGKKSKTVILFGKERQPVERIAPEAWADPHAPVDVAAMLHVAAGQTQYKLIWGAEHGQLKPRPDPDQDVIVSTRSVLGMMLYISRAVEIPRKHLEEGLVQDPVDEQGQPFDWKRVVGDLMRVQVQKTKPAHAYVATHYRGYWFYIDDADLNSKSTFALVQLVTGLELAGGVVPGPVVSVSTGGGTSVTAGGGGGKPSGGKPSGGGGG